MEYPGDIDNIEDDLGAGMPEADPAIRTDYEAALGRFILIHNEADYWLSKVIAAELSKRRRDDLIPSTIKGNFAQRLERLELLASSTKDRQLSGLPVDKLRSLNTNRNHLAHGHFDQNPYDGSYQLVLAQKAKDYPIEHIVALADELTKIVAYLRTTEILYDFEDLTIQPPEKAP
jgi:hypothetical protein